MRTVKFSLSFLALVMAFALLGTSSALAQDAIPETPPLAKVVVSSGTVAWEPLTQAASYHLEIAGPSGVYFVRVFMGEDSPLIDLLGPDGSPLPDGLYSYQLTAYPVLDPVALATLNDPAFQSDIELRLATQGFASSDVSVQSGSFSIQGGAFVQPDATQEPLGVESPNDQVIADDLIVQQSLCVGIDCINGENFGFDTIRLKENNLRIHFDDTSASAGFPANDWRIIANDSASGGASYLAVEDATAGKQVFRVDAGAPTNSLYVDSQGDVGLGTSTPVLELSIKDGDTPAIRLEQDTSVGYPAQTWDVAGNEANFFIRDVTNGSLLPFRIKPGAPKNSLFIASNGAIGIGTENPESRFQIKTSSTADYFMFGKEPYSWRFGELQSGTHFIGIGVKKIGADNVYKAETADNSLVNHRVLEVHYNGDVSFKYQDHQSDDTTLSLSTQFVIKNNGNVGIGLASPSAKLEVSGDAKATTFITTSDVNAKQNFAALDNQEVLERLMEVPVTTWSFKSDETDATHIGPTAQDFYQAFGLGKDDVTIATVDADGVAFAAIQGLNETLQQKDAEIDALEARVNSLEQMMTMPWIALTALLVAALLYTNREKILAKIHVRS